MRVKQEDRKGIKNEDAQLMFRSLKNKAFIRDSNHKERTAFSSYKKGLGVKRLANVFYALC